MPYIVGKVESEMEAPEILDISTRYPPEYQAVMKLVGEEADRLAAKLGPELADARKREDWPAVRRIEREYRDALQPLTNYAAQMRALYSPIHTIIFAPPSDSKTPAPA